MTRVKKKYAAFIAVFALVLYAFVAAAPVPEEMVLSMNWINSLETEYEQYAPDSGSELMIPFELGDYFGYVSPEGRFSVKRVKKDYVSLSDYFWAEYDAEATDIEVKDTYNTTVFSIKDNAGYPFFLDSRSFIMHQEQNSVSRLKTVSGGAARIVDAAWTYDFASTVTCVDAAAGVFLAGTLDGAIELIDDNGKRVYFSEPSGSRIAGVYGCALSKDGKKIAIVAGLDKQRFILFEQFGLTWRITFHEFLEEGLRRNVFVMFIDESSKVVFERENGLGIYDMKSRSSYRIPLDGEIAALDGNGDDEMIFLVSSKNQKEKKLVGVKFPDIVMIEAPFNSEHTFLSRRSSDLLIGGKSALASFKIEKK
ncbi:MAG: WD40 repeat domain-containing protein [Spirochaetaceae bacterium]|jgi:hypothetical protein|nr:WD40 repeat domain-containing protein [Spirochaetaceae bacterium]